LALGACGSSSSAATPVTNLTVARTPSGRTLPDGFLGLSFEFRGLEAYLGSNPAALDPVFLQLVRNLAPGGRPVLRIGGDSTDWTWWPVAGMPRPGGAKYALDARWTQVARATAAALRARLILGVNFEADSRRVAAAEAAAMLARIGSGQIAAFELGNEPELYGSFPWYKAADGSHVRGRPHGYSFDNFLPDFGAIASAMPRAPLAGPSSGSPAYLAGLGRFIGAEPRVRVATIHAYPLKHCGKLSHPTIAQLLAPGTSRALTNLVGSAATVAHRHGIALRVDEMNSVSCGGERGLTDAFAPALWALGQLFQLDRAGVDGVNFQTVPNTLQQLIGVSPGAGGKWSGQVEPEYYGLVAFAQAAPAGSRPLGVGGGLPAGVQAYATVAPAGAGGTTGAGGSQIHVALINTSRATQTFALNIPGATGAGTLSLLRAPGLGSTSGVTLGGQSIAGGTGALSGRSTATTVTPSGASYSVTVPAGSAAILAVAGAA
jgi:hypothetical protein